MNAETVFWSVFLYVIAGIVVLMMTGADFESYEVEPASTGFEVVGVVLLWPLFAIRLLFKCLWKTAKILVK